MEVAQMADNRICCDNAATMTSLDRFNAAMEYGPCDQVPHYELGVWPQTVQRWHNKVCRLPSLPGTGLMAKVSLA